MKADFAAFYESEKPVGVALVQITAMEPFKERPDQKRPFWIAKTKVKRHLVGTVAKTHVDMRFTFWPMCETRPFPKAGEQWVVYFTEDSDPDRLAFMSYPASWIGEIDDKVARAMAK
jgi:hypothetical protein